jgi:hypothetical protein
MRGTSRILLLSVRPLGFQLIRPNAARARGETVSLFELREKFY